ncbi:MAG TPA: prepilin-type cleavage/methylation domain-containing protein [Allocoleopsis sp.]
MRVRNQSNAGFTVLELIILLAVLGIVSAIAIPTWNAFINRQRLNAAQYRVYQAMQETKSNAMLQKVTWQLSVREAIANGKPIVQLATHPRSLSPNLATWRSLDTGIRLYSKETTLYTDKQNGIQRVQFNYMGNTNGQLGQLTLIVNNNSKLKRCVYVSTLIGTLRMGQEHAKANDSKKSCY